MSIFSKTPVYNLNVVLRETGLKADVLRAWERRYDLPKPQRTQGGHRLYSEYDVETVKWLHARQAEGMTISRAVDLWKSIVDAGKDPLDEAAAVVPEAAEVVPVAAFDIDTYYREWMDACRSFDVNRTEGVLNRAFATFPVETVCTALLQRGLSNVGCQWYTGSASVQQEHFMSAQAIRRLETLITEAPLPTHRQTVLLGCPAGERHVFPMLLINLLLRRRGMNVVYLGADITGEQMDETARAIRPTLIVLAAQQLTTAAALSEITRSLSAQRFPLAYGGQIFNRISKLRQRIPAHFLGETLADAVEKIEQLVATPAALPEIDLSDADLAASTLFREKQRLIENIVYETMEQTGLSETAPTAFISEANAFIGRGLAAALELGDPAFLEPDMEWVKGLLVHRNIPADRLLFYLKAYCQAVSSVMGTTMGVVDWLSSYVTRNALD